VLFFGHCLSMDIQLNKLNMSSMTNINMQAYAAGALEGLT
jgi:hypothetical protein